jgi:hypothetical protein
MRRGQYAPRMGTIIVALVLVVVGVLGTFGHLIPRIAGFAGESIGVAAYVIATLILLVGIFVNDV